MKQPEDIERLSLEELERIGSDPGIAVPENLESNLKAALAASELASGMDSGERTGRTRPDRKLFVLVPAAAAAAIAAVLLLPPKPPKDTFHDPKTAYAELEKTFAYISRKMDAGLSMTDKMNESMETVNQAINKAK